MEPIRFIVARMTNEAASRLCSSRSPLIADTLAVAEGQGHRNHFYKKYAEIHDNISNGQTFEQFQVASMIDFLSGELTRTRKTSFLFEPLGSFELDKEPYLSLATEEYSDFISYVFCNKGLGNRAPSSLFFQNGECLACSAEGQQIKLNEPHILLECPRLENARESLNMHHAVKEAMRNAGTINVAYARFWGKNRAHSLQELRNRINMANQLIEVYEADTRTILNIMKGI